MDRHQFTLQPKRPVWYLKLLINDKSNLDHEIQSLLSEGGLTLMAPVLDILPGAAGSIGEQWVPQ